MANKKDFATGVVASLSGTTLTFQTGYGSTMPTPPFYLTLSPPGQLTTLGNSEKVLVNSKTSAEVFEVTRAQGGTTSKTVTSGWIAVNSIYTADLDGNNADTVDGIHASTSASSGILYPLTPITTDANGWKVYDYGLHKEYRKRVTFSYTASGANVLSLSSSNLPVGVSNLANVFITYAITINGNAYDFNCQFEGTSSNTALNFTYSSSHSQSGFMDVTLVGQ